MELLHDPRIQETAKLAVKNQASKDKSWEYQVLADDFYKWAKIFNDELIYPVARVGRRDLPSPVIAFERMNRKILASYTLGKNSVGLDDQITFNIRHLHYPRYSLLETLCHEQVHLWQQRDGEHPYISGNNTHNAEFCLKCEKIGLHPLPVIGKHYRPADGVFKALLGRHGITLPADAVEVPKEEKRDYWLHPKKEAGTSTLYKWQCPECRFAVNATTKFDIKVHCGQCEQTPPPLMVRAVRK